MNNVLYSDGPDLQRFLRLKSNRYVFIRIIKLLGLEWTLKIIWFQAPAMGRNVTHCTTAAWETLSSLSGEDEHWEVLLGTSWVTLPS